MKERNPHSERLRSVAKAGMAKVESLSKRTKTQKEKGVKILFENEINIIITNKNCRDVSSY